MKIARVENDFSVGEFDHQNWKKAEEISIEKYWSGEFAPSSRHAKGKLLWSAYALYIRFEAYQSEPLVISEKPILETKTRGLWDRDVCEIFIAPNREEPNRYFEFEIAPTGEWLDLEVRQFSGNRRTDFDYDSKMKSAAKIENGKVWMAIKMEWQAFGRIPKSGDVWCGNLFRCVGSGETRGYLAWQPTRTDAPNFHIPEAFGEFEFVNFKPHSLVKITAENFKNSASSASSAVKI